MPNRISRIVIGAVYLLGMFIGGSSMAGFAASGSEAQSRNAKGEIQVLDPVGVISIEAARVKPAPRLNEFSGKKIWIVVINYGSTLMPAVARLLPEYAPGAQIEIKDASKSNPFFMLKPANRPDAVIAGNGICEGTTLNAANYSKQAEKLGIPAVVSFNSDVYYGHQEAVHKLSFPGLKPYATELPDPGRKEDPERLARLLIPQLIEGLTRPVGQDRPRICFAGTEDEAQAYFEALKWNGGVPIVLPTEAKVTELLKGTSHNAAEVVGVMAPGMRNATVEKVAIQAVMAGCTPEQMPAALALAELFCQKDVGEVYGTRRPPALKIAVTGPEAATSETPDAPGAASIERLARLMLIHLGGIPSPVMAAKRLSASLSEQGKSGQCTVTIMDGDRSEVWEHSTTTADKWK